MELSEQGKIVKLILSHDRQASFQDLGIIDDNFVSKLIFEGKEYLNSCPVKDVELNKDMMKFRYMQDCGFFGKYIPNFEILRTE